MLTVRSLAGCAVMVVLAAPVLAQDLIVTPGTMPATRPATRPAKPVALGKVSPDAQPLLQGLADACGKLTGLDASGKMTLTISEEPTPDVREVTFTSSYLAPNCFRHAAKDQPLFGCTGQKLYGYWRPGNVYFQKDVPQGKLSFADLPPDLAKVLPQQNPLVLLATAKDPVEMLRSLATQIDKAPDQTIDGKSFPAVSIKLAETGNTMVVAIDPQTNLIRRASTDLMPEMTKAGRGDLKAAAFTVEYTKVMPDAPLEADLFAWTAPASGRDAGAAKGPVIQKIDAPKAQ